MITKNNVKSYCILGRHKKTGEIYGYQENSFSMSLSTTHTRLHKIIPYYFKNFDNDLTRHEKIEQKERQNEVIKFLQKQVDELNKKYSRLEFFLVRVNSRKCPVWFDWKSFRKAKNKFDRRNISFTTKAIK